MSGVIDFLKQSDQEIIDEMNARDIATLDEMNARDIATLDNWYKCFNEADKETAKDIEDICEIVRKLSYKYDIGYREIMDDMVVPFFEVED